MTVQYDMMDIIIFFAGTPPNATCEIIMYLCACIMGLYLMIYIIQVIGFLVGILKYRMI